MSLAWMDLCRQQNCTERGMAEVCPRLGLDSFDHDTGEGHCVLTELVNQRQTINDGLCKLALGVPKSLLAGIAVRRRPSHNFVAVPPGSVRMTFAERLE